MAQDGFSMRYYVVERWEYDDEQQPVTLVWVPRRRRMTLGGGATGVDSLQELLALVEKSDAASIYTASDARKVLEVPGRLPKREWLAAVKMGSVFL